MAVEAAAGAPKTEGGPPPNENILGGAAAEEVPPNEKGGAAAVVVPGADAGACPKAKAGSAGALSAVGVDPVDGGMYAPNEKVVEVAFAALASLAGASVETVGGKVKRAALGTRTGFAFRSVPKVKPVVVVGVE